MTRNLLISFFFFFSCLSFSPMVAAKPLSELTIYYANDVRGEIEPCG